jgi:hypothetical protein
MERPLQRISPMPTAPTDQPPTLPPPPAKPRSWVENVNGKPRVRWLLIAPILAIVGVQILAPVFFTSPLQMPSGRRVPFLGLFFAYEMILIAGIAIVYVELQRQKIFSGKSKWQIGLGATMLLTVLAAILFSLLGYEYREYRRDQDKFLTNQKKITAMVSIITGGNSTATLTVMDLALDGSRLACYVQRATFDNNDLSRLIDVACDHGTTSCPIESLWLSLSVVDEKALRESLPRMPRLEELAYFRYPIEENSVDDATVDAIILHCPKLRNLSWNMQTFTPEQRDRLRTHFPELKVNGKVWEQQ